MPNLKGLSKGLPNKKAMADRLGKMKKGIGDSGAAMGKSLEQAKDKAAAATRAAKNTAAAGLNATGRKAAAASKYMASKASAAKEAFKNMEIFQRFNPITWIILFNLVLRLVLYFSSIVGKKSQNVLKKKKHLARHMRETFGIALVSTGILYYMTVYFPKEPDNVIITKDSILLLLYFLTLVYDYIIGMTNLIPKKYFTQTKKKQAKLGGIYFGMILGSAAFFAVLVMLLYGLQTEFLEKHYNMFSKTFNAAGDFTYIPIIISSAMFLTLFAVSIVTFFILNTDLQNKKKMYKGDHKAFYTDMFRMFYILLMISFVMLILFTETNLDKIPKF